jgi:hypothetical protein
MIMIKKLKHNLNEISNLTTHLSFLAHFTVINILKHPLGLKCALSLRHFACSSI